MYGQNRWLGDMIKFEPSDRPAVVGGLFLEQTDAPAFISLVLSEDKCSFPASQSLRLVKRRRQGQGRGFLSVSLSIKGGGQEQEGYVGESGENWGQNGNDASNTNLAAEAGNETTAVKEEKEEKKVTVKRSEALNTTNHLFAGAIAAAVSRFPSIISYVSYLQFSK